MRDSFSFGGFDPEVLTHVSEGDLFRLNGKRYRLVKKTTTAISAERYFWFDAVGEFLMRKLGRA